MEEPNNAEWQAPPPPEEPSEPAEQSEMSEIGTIANMYLEPGRTFRDLRIKPRFILATVLAIVCGLGFWFAIDQKIGMGEIFVDQLKKSPQYEQMSPQQRDGTATFYRGPAFKGIVYGGAVFGTIFYVLIGGLIYWLLANAFGGTSRYLHGVSVWAYSVVTPGILAVLANVLVLMLKSKDDLDTAAVQSGGFVRANPTAFIDVTHSPVLNALLSPIDLFQIWGVILAVIGIRTVAKISNGSAWTIVLGLKLVGIIIGVTMAAIFGGAK
jgi:hypothetical protein